MEKTIGATDLHETECTPWEGQMTMERPSVTVLRCTVTVKGGQFLGAQGDRRDPLAAGCMKGSCPCPTTPRRARPICISSASPKPLA
jgi:hypothetical protein